MTDPTRTAQRKMLVVVVAVVVLISAYWTIRALSHRSNPKKPRATAELVDELRGFDRPANARPEGMIAPLQNDPAHNVVALYRSESDCQTLATYYKKEFARHGFQPRRRTDEEPKPESEAMSFYGHDTWGYYSCNAHGYLVGLRPTTSAE